MKDKIKIICLFGPSSCGKDSVLRWVCNNNKNLHKIINYTTRPPRANETNGQDYFFLTEEEFGQQVIQGKMLETSCFNNWFYGTSIDGLNKNKINIGVFNIQAIEYLLEDDELEIYPVYIYATEEQRLKRAINRTDSPDFYEICRRFIADEEDFGKYGTKIPFDFCVFNNSHENLYEYKDFFNIPLIKKLLDEN